MSKLDSILIKYEPYISKWTPHSWHQMEHKLQNQQDELLMKLFGHDEWFKDFIKNELNGFHIS